MTPSRNPYGLTLWPTGHLSLSPGLDNHGHVAGSPPDPGGAAEGPGAIAPQRRPFVHPCSGNDEVLRDGMTLLGVGHGRLQHLAERSVRSEGRKPKDSPG